MDQRSVLVIKGINLSLEGGTWRVPLLGSVTDLSPPGSLRDQIRSAKYMQSHDGVIVGSLLGAPIIL
jgi:hypothetical protein